MLLNSFYTILSTSERTEISPAGVSLRVATLELSLDAAHPIFGGHFPGNPVVPGVCQVQMITESLGSVTGKSMRLNSADTVKFLSMINPLADKDLSLELTVKPPVGDTYPVQAVLAGREKTILKLKGQFSAAGS
jgi:3-hydroxyacyl-[acyl-carrier-protein] dehydratase